MALRKHVHFAESPCNMYTYTPPATPCTPSPTWSDSSLHDDDDDSGPSTPPSASSFPPRALPSTFYDSPTPKQPVTASPILFDPRTQCAPLVWNVTTPPSTAGVRGAARKGKGKASSNANVNTHTLLPSDLSLPATNPGMSTLDVHIPQLPPFWKPIHLRSSSSPLGSGSGSGSGVGGTPITLGEVLDAVHRYVNSAVSQKEFDMFPPDVQKAVAKTYWRRHDAAANAGRAEEAAAINKAGIRRVDALAGNTHFVAFVPMSMSNKGDAWQVILAAPKS